MSDAAFQPSLDFEAADVAVERGEALILDLDGFEGPLDLLLALARSQKVDLRQIAIAPLADQYLAFVHQAARRRFSLAADYLVMAAWLTYLKSRLLLPKAERPMTEEPAEELAEALAFRLAKLDAMRQAVEALKALPRTGRDVFTRGDPSGLAAAQEPPMEGDLFQLLAAYVGLRRKREARRYEAAARVEAYPLEAARLRLQALLPTLDTWTPLVRLAPAGSPDGGGGASPASHLASTFAAGLEMVKDGALELRQLEAFATLYLKARAAPHCSVEQAA